MRILAFILPIVVIACSAALARAQTPPVTMDFCPTAPAVRSGDLVVVRSSIVSHGQPMVYRVDDASGYWTYPASVGANVALKLPPDIGSTITVQGQRVDADGKPQPCSPMPAVVSEGALPENMPLSPIVPVAHVAERAACAQPFSPGRLVSAAQPFTPTMARDQHVSGTVEVAIVIGTDGIPLETTVYKSPSILLNESALKAARDSVYVPAVFRCKAVPSKYLFGVEFRY